MGSGVSTDAIDITPCLLSDGIRQYYDKVEAIKMKIAVDDAMYLGVEKRKMMKSHSKIIERFASRTRGQLARAQKKNDRMCQILKDFSSTYGPFFNVLLMEKSQIDAMFILGAVSGIGVDEGMFTRIVSLCHDGTEFSAIDEYLAKLNKGKLCNQNLLSFVEGKFEDGSCHRKFLEFILMNIFRDDTVQTAEHIIEQATKLNALLLTVGDDMSELLEILCVPSRFTAQSIRLAYEQQFDSKLNDDIFAKFSKHGDSGAFCTLGLVLWTLPLENAVGHMLSSYSRPSTLRGKVVKPNSEFIFSMVCKYDKPFMAQVNTAHESTHGRDLCSDLKGVLKGQVLQAVKCYIEAPSPDQGLEYAIDSFIYENGNNYATIMENDILGNRLKDLLETQLEKLSTYINESFVPIKMINSGSIDGTSSSSMNVADIVEVAQIADEEGEPKEEMWEEVDAPASADIEPTANALEPLIDSAMYQQTVSDMKDFSIDSSAAVVKQYLQMLFEVNDVDGSGELPAQEFWTLVNDMNMDEFGFTQEEIAILPDLCEWVKEEGIVAYEEIVDEFSSSIVSTMRAQGLEANITDIITKRISAVGMVVDTEEKDMPNLEAYLYDTFAKYDSNQSNGLDREEFRQMMAAMNLGLTVVDENNIWSCCNVREAIHWDEAHKRLTKVLHDMASDNRDHWVGLVDGASGLLFWYNLRNQESQWMSEEDQADYKAQATLYGTEGGRSGSAPRLAGPSETASNDTSKNKLVHKSSKPSSKPTSVLSMFS